jgi:Fuc2NAc and GlcNAc transferase
MVSGIPREKSMSVGAEFLEIAATVALSFFLALGLTGVIRVLVLRRGVLDVPNHRSSHAIPTPRGGGLAIVLAMVAVLAAQYWMRRSSESVLAALAGGLAVAAVGFRDDHHPVSAGVRLLVHVAAAAWAVWWLGGLPPMQIGEHLVGFGRFGALFGVLGIIWVLNLFNFMDGIDGIAGSEAAFIGIVGGAFALAQPGHEGIAVLSLAFGGASIGFLCWNWAPARIFMGDVGSGFVGFFIAVLAVGIAQENPSGLLVWLILGGVFFVDATVTLVRRLARGERVYLAHRSHAYQRLSRRWRSHSKVSLAVTGVNLGWLLPWAVVANFYPSLAIWCVLAALGPLTGLAIALGAGRDE